MASVLERRIILAPTQEERVPVMKEERLAIWMQQYEKMVYSICCRLVQNEHTAQDLAQETFLSAYLHSESCPAENEKAWLARIAVNKAKDYLKSAYNRRVCAAPDGQLPEDGAVLFAADMLPEHPHNLKTNR